MRYEATAIGISDFHSTLFTRSTYIQIESPHLSLINDTICAHMIAILYTKFRFFFFFFIATAALLLLILLYICYHRAAIAKSQRWENAIKKEETIFFFVHSNLRLEIAFKINRQTHTNFVHMSLPHYQLWCICILYLLLLALCWYILNGH